MPTPRRRLRLHTLGLALAVFGASATSVAQDAPRPPAPPAQAPKAQAPKAQAPRAQAPKAAPEAPAPAEAPSDARPSEVEPSPEEAPAKAKPENDVAPEEAPAEATPSEAANDAGPVAPAAPVEPTAPEKPAAPEPEAPVEPAGIPAASEPAAEIAAGAPSPEAAPQNPVFAYVPSAPRDERPEILPYVEGDAVPDGYRVDARMRRGLVIAGGVTFGVAYLASVGAALQVSNDELDAIDEHFDDESTASMLYIPVVGPFIAAGQTNVEDRGGAAAVLVFDGIAQAAGLSMFVAGLAAKKTVLVKDERGSVALAPGAVGTAAGLTALGTF